MNVKSASQQTGQLVQPTVATVGRVFIETFGCQMNTVDSELALGRLLDYGWRRSNTADHADLILLNTCAVRDGAEARVRGRLDSLQARKAAQPELLIAVMGCMAQHEGAAMARRWPHVDLVIGSDQFPYLPQLLERLQDEAQVIATDFHDFESERDWRIARREGVNAWVSVMRGCDYACTYCIVPQTRGPERSRSMESIEREVRQAVDAGFAQVTLLGQTVDSYGRTRGDGSSLAGLLRRLHLIEGLQRLRFVTSHPCDVDDDLLHAIAALPKVAKHLHIPAQSGSARILRRMLRRYDRDGYLRLVERARRLVPGIELLTDLIVGFPGETEEDHAQTRSLMEKVRFDGTYVFIYSPRPGTAAARLPMDVPPEIARTRCTELLALQLRQQERRYAGLIGEVCEVLVEGPSKSNAHRLQGRSHGNLNVLIDRQGSEGPRDGLVGRIVPIEIHAATGLSLYGTPTDRTPTFVGSGGRD